MTTILKSFRALSTIVMLQGLFLCILDTGQARRGGGGRGGGTLLYKPYRYVPPQRVWFLRRFRLKTGIEFAHLGLESDMVFERATGGLNVFVVDVVSIPNE